MKELGIEKIGCHANRCAGGAPPYDGMSTEDRKEIQYRLIVDIAAAKLFGTVSIIDMEVVTGAICLLLIVPGWLRPAAPRRRRR